MESSLHSKQEASLSPHLSSFSSLLLRPWWSWNLYTCQYLLCGEKP